MTALHQSVDGDPKILTDPIAPLLISGGADRAWLAPFLEHPFAQQWRAGFALRARYAEDSLAEAVGRGTAQYVILGAGLDTFAYRQPSWAAPVAIYEIDHPATQAWKKERLQAAGVALPPNLRFVPIDFERTSISQALSATDFTSGAPAFCSWMGVTQYLTRAALEATFRFVLALPPCSEIVFSFILPGEAVAGVEGQALALAAERAAAIGEPWLTRILPGELARWLQALGFSRTTHLTPEEAHHLYFANRTDGLMERHGEQLMRALV